jgi:hypothetical protein
MDIVLVVVWARRELPPLDDLDGVELVVSPSAQNPRPNFDRISGDFPAPKVVFLAAVALLFTHRSLRSLSALSQETLTPPKKKKTKKTTYFSYHIRYLYCLTIYGICIVLPYTVFVFS